MAERPSRSTPTLVSLLLCDQLIDDRFTNKKSAIGMFNTIISPTMPTVIQQVTVLASLTELSGQSIVELRLVRDADNGLIFSGNGRVDAPNPLAVVDLIFTLQGIQLPTPGQYAMELWSSDDLLGRRRFQLFYRPPTPAQRHQDQTEPPI
ncbi:MAG: hypothetical protein JNG88_05720 [Phycisphaerales bacterium]|nr:hypothetical protein [Phycisphaerales bacterium]